MYVPGFHEAYLTFAGVGFAVGINMLQKRPPYASLYRHVIGAAIGYGAGFQLNAYIRRREYERDVMLMDYIQRHPDDFRSPPRQKWGELLEQWVPIR